MVIASGEILTVSSKSHPDLFWAIRGGGTNFGAVTEFVYQLHPQRATVFVGPVVFPPARLQEVTEVMEKWYSNSSEDEGAMLATTSKGRSGGPEISVIIFFNGDEEEGRKRFKIVFDLGQ